MRWDPGRPTCASSLAGRDDGPGVGGGPFMVMSAEANAEALEREGVCRDRRAIQGSCRNGTRLVSAQVSGAIPDVRRAFLHGVHAAPRIDRKRLDRPGTGGSCGIYASSTSCPSSARSYPPSDSIADRYSADRSTARMRWTSGSSRIAAFMTMSSFSSCR